MTIPPRSRHPPARRRVPAYPAAVTPDATASRTRVLIVEDHRLVAEALGAALDLADDLVVVGMAGSVDEAHRLVADRRPDVVLMDRRLPDGDGVRAAAALTTSWPDLKVVIVTASDDESIVLSAMEAGCAGYVTKFRPIPELIQAVRSARAGELLVSPAVLAALAARMRAGAQAPRTALSARERQVLQLLAAGLYKEDIARQLGITATTVRNHTQSILGKLKVHSKLEAVAVGMRLGLVRAAEVGRVARQM
jgi:DNA-binding NarL/FixJ family response regulator